MTKTVIDIETTNFNDDPRPYNPSNYLVSVGFKEQINGVWEGTKYLCFKHSEVDPTPNGSRILQDCLWTTDLLVGHNIKFDLSWLLECGFEYEGEIYDTMIYEYLKLGGIRKKKDLSSCCKRRGLSAKIDLTSSYLKEKVGFESIPWKLVEEYGINDVNITCNLYEAQRNELHGK
jgi:DNA polymerase I-like protein with 3'-5' exonuclease and polymerase domains